MSDSFDDWQDEWMKAFREAGHEPVLKPTDEWGDHGEERVDYFHTSGGHHNGPGCRKCGWSCCMHCVPAKRIPRCPKTEQAVTSDRADAITALEAERDALKAENERLRDLVWQAHFQGFTQATLTDWGEGGHERAWGCSKARAALEKGEG